MGFSTVRAAVEENGERSKESGVRFLWEVMGGLQAA